MAGADLSKLDLRYINFKYANLKGCKLAGSNLSWCCLERSDLSNAILDGAQLIGERHPTYLPGRYTNTTELFVGVKSLCANMEGAQLRNCNFEDPAGSRANMEGVNLRGADLEGSDMGGVNLRVATLKNASLQNCDLRAAVLAGADLEVSTQQFFLTTNANTYVMFGLLFLIAFGLWRIMREFSFAELRFVGQ